jgi:F-type H+-transporting ATPase subunit b
MSLRSTKALAASLLLAGVTVAVSVDAQQPPTGRPAAAQPAPGGQMPPPGAQPPGRPNLPTGVQPGMQPGMPAGHPPMGQPGMPPGAQGQPRGPSIQKLPGPPPGFQGKLPPRPAPAPAAKEESHEAAHAGHCPGHGPYDAVKISDVNWWRGFIAVNNDAAKFETDDAGHEHRVDPFLSQLLWRYDNKADPCDHKSEAPPFLASIFNFGLLVFLLVRFGKKPLGEALKKRKDDIMKEIDTAATLRRQSKARLAEYETKIDRIEDTLAELREEYATQAEAEKKRVLEEAEERRVRMKRDAEFRVEQERKAARIAVMSEAVDRATAKAEELMTAQSNKSDADRLVEEYLASIPSTFGKSDGPRAGGAA